MFFFLLDHCSNTNANDMHHHHNHHHHHQHHQQQQQQQQQQQPKYYLQQTCECDNNQNQCTTTGCSVAAAPSVDASTFNNTLIKAEKIDSLLENLNKKLNTKNTNADLSQSNISQLNSIFT